MIQYVSQPVPLRPVYRKKETRIKFNYLRKRHNISPKRDGYENNSKIAEIIRERGSSTTVTIERVLPSIYHKNGVLTKATSLHDDLSDRLHDNTFNSAKTSRAAVIVKDARHANSLVNLTRN